MRMTADQWRTAVQQYAIDRLPTRRARCCGYILGFLTPAITMWERGVLFDHGCDCSTREGRGMTVRQSSWEEVARAMATVPEMTAADFLHKIAAGDVLGAGEWEEPTEAHGEEPDKVIAEAVRRSGAGLPPFEM
jgi:hypothetical protein